MAKSLGLFLGVATGVAAALPISWVSVFAYCALVVLSVIVFLADDWHIEQNISRHAFAVFLAASVTAIVTFLVVKPTGWSALGEFLRPFAAGFISPVVIFLVVRLRDFVESW